MAKSLPPLTWFRAFDAAARHLSFTIAARDLGLTQSAVSQHVRSLEDRLGTPLFHRLPRGLSLTDDGRRLVPDVAAAMARLRTATDAFAPSAAQDVLTIATSVSFAQWYLAPGLSAFCAEHPDIRLRIVTTVWPDDFASTAADIEIRFGTSDVVGRRAAPLGNGQLMAVVAPRVLGRSDWRRMLEHPLIQPVGISWTWDALLRRAGLVSPREPALFADSHGLAVDLAVCGVGAALTSALIAAPALQRGDLVRLPLEAVTADERYFIARNATDQEASQTQFVDWLDSRIARSDAYLSDIAATPAA